MREIVRVVLGDWSDDGHGKTETYVIKTNLSGKELEKAFKAGVKKSGFDITEHCGDNEDYAIPDDLYDYFEKAGVVFDSIQDEPGNHFCCTDDFFHVYMKTCEIGNDTLKWSVEKNYDNEIRIGGYGLFC